MAYVQYVVYVSIFVFLVMSIVFIILCCLKTGLFGCLRRGTVSLAKGIIVAFQLLVLFLLALFVFTVASQTAYYYIKLWTGPYEPSAPISQQCIIQK